MRYFFKKTERVISQYGREFEALHPIYDKCTLYKIGKKGLAVIQQRFDPKTKHTYWGPIDDYLTDAIYLNPNFLGYFESKAGEAIRREQPGKKNKDEIIFPTVTVRQIMWALRMKPLKKEPWETVFDRNPI